MGCNCKNKTEAKKITQEVQQKVQVVIDVTLQEVMVIENLIPDINSNAEKRAAVSDFMFRTFGEVIINYCGQVCQKGLKEKIRNLKKQL
jgi:hypothetical protein